MSENHRAYHVVTSAEDTPYVASPLGDALLYLESEKIAELVADRLNRETSFLHEEIARLKAELEAAQAKSERYKKALEEIRDTPLCNSPAYGMFTKKQMRDENLDMFKVAVRALAESEADS